MNEINTNIFRNIPQIIPEELIESLIKRDKVTIERIISKGHTTPKGEWYDQVQDEWVLLIQGQAIIVYEMRNQSIHLNVGDFLLIPAHTRHRVEWTNPDLDTIWLAVHMY